MEQDQLDELEALSAIFPSEFRELSVQEGADIVAIAGWDATEIKHLIHLKLAPDTNDNGEIHVGVSLYGAMRASYPGEAALLVHCLPAKGLSSSLVDELNASLTQTAADSLGMPSIYTMAEAAREWLQKNNVPGLDGSMYAEMMRREQQKVVAQQQERQKVLIKQAADSEKKPGEVAVDEKELERIRKRQAGTAVTMETFVAWKKNFDDEMAAKKIHKSSAQDEEKLTGKQWFVSGKAATDAAAEDDFIAQQELEVQDMGEDEEDDEDDEDYVEGEEDGGDDNEDDEDYVDEEA